MTTPTSTFRKSTVREYFESIVIAVILALFVRTWVVQAFKIPTGSMEQNLLIGDHLLVNKFVYSPLSNASRMLLPTGTVERGDILVFKFPEDPGRDFIKRVIGLPGETLEVRGKQVYINGEKLDEPYLEGQRTSQPGRAARGIVVDRRDAYGPISVPPEHYFMMGDNRDNSQDSRFWGPLSHAYVKGKAIVIYWSFDGAPELIPQTGFGATLRRITAVATNFFTGTRWDRMLKQVS
jgi:signal peptidase I